MKIKCNKKRFNDALNIVNTMICASNLIQITRLFYKKKVCWTIVIDQEKKTFWHRFCLAVLDIIFWRESRKKAG